MRSLGAMCWRSAAAAFVAEHGCVERVASQMGGCGGVGRLSRVGHVDGVNRDHLHLLDVVVRRVDHHGRVDVVEGAPADHELLASAALLGRRAENGDTPPERFSHSGRRESGAEPRSGDHVVAARVTDPRQCVVLAAHRNGRARGSDSGVEGSRHVVRPAVDGQPLSFDGVGEDLVGMMLLEPEFRVCMQRVRDLQQLRSQALDLGSDRLLRLDYIHPAILGPPFRPSGCSRREIWSTSAQGSDPDVQRFGLDPDAQRPGFADADSVERHRGGSGEFQLGGATAADLDLRVGHMRS